MRKATKTEYLNVRLDPQTMRALESFAAQMNCSKSEAARFVLNQLKPNNGALAGNVPANGRS